MSIHFFIQSFCLITRNSNTNAQLGHDFICASAVDSPVQDKPVRIFLYSVTYGVQDLLIEPNVLEITQFHIFFFGIFRISSQFPTDNVLKKPVFKHASVKHVVLTYSFSTIWVKCFPICQYYSSPSCSRGPTWPCRVSRRSQNAFEGL